MGKVNFNTKHLQKGDPMPPYNGKLRIYNMRYCPWAQRAILALIAKQVDFEVVNIDITNKPDWFISKSPFGKVPSLEIADGVCIYESLVASEYIDEIYPQRPLRFKDPVQKAFDRIITEAYGVQPTYYKALRTPETITEEDSTSFYRAVDFVQEQLRQRGTTFLGGNEPGFVDYTIWPWFERIVMLDGIGGHVSIDKQKYKLLGQLCVTGQLNCLFGILTGETKPVHIIKIKQDESFWKEKIESQLIRFYDMSFAQNIDP